MEYPKMQIFTCDSDKSAPSNCLSAPEEQLGITKLASNFPKKRAGRKKFRETRHPVYRGVRQRDGGKWVCEVRNPNDKSRLWLGTHPTPEMAARAHDVAALAFRGRSACVNFADSAQVLPIPKTGDVRDIQKAAAEAADMYRPEVSESVRESEQNYRAEEAFFMEEEAELGFLGMLQNMAQGLLLPPPPIDDLLERDDGMEYNIIDGSLWNFSL